MRSNVYNAYVDALVSWGYVVVQYQVEITGVLSNIGQKPAVDRVEVSKFQLC